MKLGLIGPKRDRLGRTLQLGRFLSKDFAYPAACDLVAGIHRDDNDLGNVDVGCCAVAGPGHYVRWADEINLRWPRVDRDAVLREYSAISGYDPARPETDVGCYAIDVMRKWRKEGLFGTRIEAFAQVDYTNAMELARAQFLFGGVFLCLALPKSAQGKDEWQVEADDGGRWGGHLVWCEATNVANSWGKRIPIAREFIARYCYEAWAVVSRDALVGGQRAFSGVDLEGLMRAVAEVTA